MEQNAMEIKRQKMISLLEKQLPEEGRIFPAVKGVKLFRTDKSFPRTPTSYTSQIIMMAQGEKHIYLGNNIYTYNPSKYLVLPVPLPLECEAVAPPEGPILGLSINVEPAIVGEILLEMDHIDNSREYLPKGIYGALMTDKIADAAIRLLEAIQSARDSRILAPMIVREIIYLVITGENGEALQALAYRDRRFFQIARALNKIHETYHHNLDVKSLAMEAGMSLTSFHTCFRSITDTSPLQYIKNVRLHKAREIMIQDGISAYSAALRVGYESSSQFNREYKRFFGITPAKDTAGLKSHHAVPN